ncbi:MAG: endolytic transglycosylase MltG, partial [Actinobacteria bacterium]|nr:endolytic transglycosylase MltG [Actinomycetota bacterium]
VIYNRLHEGMTLGIDSTIRFATGNYEEPLTQSELESESPYNTRTHAGLPPGPINSPGLAAMQAAAHPAKTDYLFYVNNPNSCNELTFAKTEEEFLADAAKYEKAREANGGNQPSTCK